MLATGAGDSEGTFWTVILMIVLLCCGVGIWSVAKRRKGEKDYKIEEILYPTDSQSRPTRTRKSAFEVISPQEHSTDGSSGPLHLKVGFASSRNRRKSADLESGLELLELPFLAGLVSDIEDTGLLDIQIRIIAFNEIVRREKLGRIEGKTLKIYAKNSQNIFGKSIQCRAIGELACRTSNEKHTLSNRT